MSVMEKPSTASGPKLSKQTAYFLFSLENRESVRDECIAAGMTNPNGASVAKVMGEKWNGLSEEEKRFYKEKSFQLSLEVDQQKKDSAANGEEDDDENTQKEWDPCATRIPLTRIRRIMRSDLDVRLVMQESLTLIAKATEYFIEHMVECAAMECLSKKRKTIMYADIENSVAQDPTMSPLLYAHLWAGRPLKMPRSSAFGGSGGSAGTTAGHEGLEETLDRTSPSAPQSEYHGSSRALPHHEAPNVQTAKSGKSRQQADDHLGGGVLKTGMDYGGSLAHGNKGVSDSDDEFCIAE
mmetsp:Transcript_14622/g.28134  ORF Transcript_14622/g.28134 Transcript_14622/m.28134 type:complete len:296 (+) Transcript_14622:153-1040(+)